jgi:DNA-directed RNA polymerase I, II, and III subunit RPABC2
MADDADYDGEEGLGEDIADVLETFEQVTGETTDTAAAGIRPELRKLYSQHPELIIDYANTIEKRLPLRVVPPSDEKGDAHHTTYPFLTLYEKTKIIGLRANQLSQGARPFISVPKHMTDVRDIARLELEQKRLPYIVKRPLPNGTFEYWRLADLMIL